MMTVKEDLARRIAALPTASSPEEAFRTMMNTVAQVQESVLSDVQRQLSSMTIEEKIDYLAQLSVKHEVDAAMMDLGFKQLVAQLNGNG